MKAEIFSLHKKPSTNITEYVDQTQSLRIVPTEFLEEFDHVHSRSSGSVGTTGEDAKAADKVGEDELPTERIYPHVFDEDRRPGQALIFLRNAISDTKAAIDAFGDADLRSVSTRLTQIAVAMGKAHSLTDFNESLGAVVSYIRRAMLAASAEELTRSALNSLLGTLEFAAANPMIDLDEAYDLVDRLENDGWQGEHRLANELVAALVSDFGLIPDEVQALLLPEVQAAN